MLYLHEILSVLCALSVGLGILFEKKLKIQPTIALLITSTIITQASYFVNNDTLKVISSEIFNLPFDEIFLSYMLGLLLFAGAVHVKLDNIKKLFFEISVLAFISTIMSIGIVGVLIHLLAQYLGISLPWIDCLIFGAIISPTDPIAIFGLLKELKAPDQLTTIIAGESLFNDGVGIVIFNALCAMKIGLSSPTLLSISSDFIIVGAGGICFGLMAYWLLKKIFQNPLTFAQKIMLMISFIICGYEITEIIHISGALFVVTLGLATNNLIINSTDKRIIFAFWEVIDEFLNLILFLLMGFVAIKISNDLHDLEIYFGLCSIPLVILTRLICVKGALYTTSFFKKQPKNLDIIICWTGLRGALAIALALSAPRTDLNLYHTLLVATYINVLFSVIIQGLTSKSLLKWYLNEKTS